LFFSPKVNHNVTVEIELTKGSDFSVWQIRRLLNLQGFFMQLGEDYDEEMHELMRSSLAGISDAVVKDELKGMTNRITESDSAKQIMQRFNFKLK
jgi:hypothetical protein